MAQRNRGDRAYMPLRPPTDQQEHYKQKADELGISLGSYGVMRLAQAEGLPVPDYITDEIEQARRKRLNAAARRRTEQLSFLEVREDDTARGGQPLARTA
ncbi:hypothetical protein E4U02_07735 [Microbacterium paludicola]|uniref:Uncharacterized protein n=1 Tax=Microbacterium paludicola TaxID=300019 RepID=A0A4Y9FV36_9MICO|nr:hypothetical protein [Microbacterium paludicola]MBF0816300.1 hypothetical protein [Microbacterium paludicola]TFU33094.1 hypothetical protein E4U02_07735 [Microbacterium paludicola]